MLEYLPPNTKIKYKRYLHEFVNDVYQTVGEEIHTGFIFLVEIREDSILYKVKPVLTSWTWNYVNPSDILEILD